MKKSPSTQASKFVEEEIRHVREGKHGARSAKQAIAIGLSKARKAGVPLPPRGEGSAKGNAQPKARRKKAPSRRRSRATEAALKKEPRNTVSKEALSKQTRSAAHERGPGDLRRAARKAAGTRRRA
jgi:hypothetical protein